MTDFNTHPPPDRGVICSEKNRIASGAPPSTAEAASHPGKTFGPSPTRPRPTWGPGGPGGDARGRNGGSPTTDAKGAGADSKVEEALASPERAAALAQR